MYECAALHPAPPHLDTDDYPLLGLHDVKVTQYRRGEPERLVDLFDVIQSGPFRVRGILEPVPQKYRKVMKRSSVVGAPLLISSVHTYSMEHVLVRGEGRREARIWVLGKAAWYEIHPGIEYLGCYKAMVEKTAIWMFLGQNVERYTARPSRKFPRLEMADVYRNYCEYDTACRTTRAAAKLFDKCTRFLVFKMAGEEEIKKWRGTTVWDYYKENYGDVLEEALDYYGHSKEKKKVRRNVPEADKEEGLLTPEYTDDDDGCSDESESTADVMEAEDGEGNVDEDSDENTSTGDAMEAEDEEENEDEEPDENTSTGDVAEVDDGEENDEELDENMSTGDVMEVDDGEENEVEEENENMSTGEAEDEGSDEDMSTGEDDEVLDENMNIGDVTEVGDGEENEDETDDADLEEEDGEENEDEELGEDMSIEGVTEVGDEENEKDDDNEAEDGEEDEETDDDADTDDEQESDQHTPAPHDPGKTTSSKGCSILRPRRSEIPVLPDTHQVVGATASPLGFHGTRIKRGAATAEIAVALSPPTSKKQIIEQPKTPYFSRKSEGFWRCTLDEPKCNHVIPNAKTRDGRNEVEKHYKSHGKVMRDALITLDEEEGKGGYQLGHLFGKIMNMQKKWVDSKPTPLKGLGE